MAWFPFKGGRLIQVKITKKDKQRTAIGWPRPLNRGGRLIQVTNTAFVRAKNRDFENWPLNRGWSLNTGPLYTGSTVFWKIKMCLTVKTALMTLDLLTSRAQSAGSAIVRARARP